MQRTYNLQHATQCMQHVFATCNIQRTCGDNMNTTCMQSTCNMHLTLQHDGNLQHATHMQPTCNLQQACVQPMQHATYMQHTANSPSSCVSDLGSMPSSDTRASFSSLLLSALLRSGLVTKLSNVSVVRAPLGNSNLMTIDSFLLLISPIRSWIVLSAPSWLGIGIPLTSTIRHPSQTPSRSACAAGWTVVT